MWIRERRKSNVQALQLTSSPRIVDQSCKHSNAFFIQEQEWPVCYPGVCEGSLCACRKIGASQSESEDIVTMEVCGYHLDQLQRKGGKQVFRFMLLYLRATDSRATSRHCGGLVGWMSRKVKREERLIS